MFSPGPQCDIRQRQLTALCILLGNIRRTRIRRTPIQRSRIRMHPEEPLVSPLAMALPDRLPRILVQELADHGLRDCVDDRRVRRTASGHVHTRSSCGCISWILYDWLMHARVEIRRH